MLGAIHCAQFLNGLKTMKTSYRRFTPRVRCIKLAFRTLPERDCWKKLLEDEGFLVVKANTKEVCYEQDDDTYDPDAIPEIDCECSGCRIYQ